MNHAVGDNNAVHVARLARIVPQGCIVDIGYAAAGFAKDGFGAARIPEVSARSRVHVRVRATFADDAHLQPDAAGQDGFFDPHPLSNGLNARRSMRAAFDDDQPRRDLFGRNMEGSSCSARLEKRTETGRGIVEFVGRGLVDDAEDGRSIHDESDLNRELTAMFDEFPSAIHRVDHPYV